MPCALILLISQRIVFIMHKQLKFIVEYATLGPNIAFLIFYESATKSKTRVSFKN